MSNIYIYAFFALPLSFIGIPLYIYLPEFYSSTFGISLATIGVIILVTRIFDTITDPICGYIGDRFTKHRKEIICFSAIILGICFYCLFHPILQNKTINLIIFSVTTYFAFSLLTVNHLALISSFKNKVFVSSLREGFTVFGLLLATVLPSILILKYSSSVTFQIIGVLVFVILLMCSILFFKFPVKVETSTKHYFILERLKNSILWKYFIVLFINGMAIATPSTLVIFYIKNFLLLEKYTGIFLGIYFFSAIVFISFWKKICEKIGFVNLFKLGMVGSILTFAFCYFVKSEGFVLYSMICFFSGMFFGIDLIAPTLITNSIIERNNLEGERTFIFGMTHFIAKASVAIVSGCLLIFLGYKIGDDYIRYLHIFYTIIPCIFKIFALCIIQFIKNI